MLPESWVDHLFGRLTVRYGAAFLRQWPETDLDLVKADWRTVLARLSGEAIAYGLENLPADRAPNAMQFRALCNARPAADQLALPAPVQPADPSRLRSMLRQAQTISQQRKAMGETAWCIHRIDTIAASRGGKLSEAQKHVRECCVKVLGYDPAKRAAAGEDEQAQTLAAAAA